jgi:hypothetical protein
MSLTMSLRLHIDLMTVAGKTQNFRLAGIAHDDHHSIGTPPPQWRRRMTVLEPLMLTAFLSYVMTPIATYALGFDPSFSWQYALIFGILPLLLTLPTVVPLVAVFAVFCGEGLVERCGTAIVLLGVSGATYAGIIHWMHQPETALQHLMLVVSSPFIGGILAALALAVVGFLVQAFCLIAGIKPSAEA